MAVLGALQVCLPHLYTVTRPISMLTSSLCSPRLYAEEVRQLDEVDLVREIRVHLRNLDLDASLRQFSHLFSIISHLSHTPHFSTPSVTHTHTHTPHFSTPSVTHTHPTSQPHLSHSHPTSSFSNHTTNQVMLLSLSFNELVAKYYTSV